MRALPCLFLLAACGSTLNTNENHDTSFDDVSDITPPEIEHTAVTASLPMGEDVPLTAVVTDDETGVIFVRLYYKNETDDSSAFTSSQLMPTGNEDEFGGFIPGDDERSGGMDYYIEAVDGGQNIAWSPTDGPDDPYHFRVYAPEE